MTRAEKQRGVTLIELLVALAILALVASVAVMSAPPPHGAAREEADRFAARLRAAFDAAIFSDRSLRLEISKNGYGFSAFEDGAWTSVKDVDALKPHTLRRVSLRVEIADPTLKNEEAAKTMTAAKNDDVRRVVFDPVGLAQGFTVEFSDRTEHWRVSYGSDGAIKVSSDGRS